MGKREDLPGMRRVRKGIGVEIFWGRFIGGVVNGFVVVWRT